ncbi:DUF2273 domain-containing protein [Paenibacillus sp. GSMTC-2017]|uniref:DUF2273 domain-containing protein n=1 Tax=Paenibacillus sp. GSMTC-2017 TaxID=2794350 RepID=UPI0018D8F87B|nr:DUF2273 domain-containing protein [Paenibacillus sp. GSMTC-2017]MBH5318062.1 DUF2273 domain-containing protein [Paenibacillus sp. GSMTC-2017]
MWREFWEIYWKRLVGAAVGLFFGIIYLAFGFWDMLFVALLVAIGYWFGKGKEQTNGEEFSLQRVWYSLQDKFRPFR